MNEPLQAIEAAFLCLTKSCLYVLSELFRLNQDKKFTDYFSNLTVFPVLADSLAAPKILTTKILFSNE